MIFGYFIGLFMDISMIAMLLSIFISFRIFENKNIKDVWGYLCLILAIILFGITVIFFDKWFIPDQNNPNTSFLKEIQSNALRHESIYRCNNHLLFEINYKNESQVILTPHLDDNNIQYEC